MELYAPVFNAAVAAKAKSLVALMVVPFAFLQAMVFRRRNAPFAVHLAFSLYFHAFLLLIVSVALVIPAVDLLFGGAGLESQNLDASISIGLLGICAVYLSLAMKTVYQAKGMTRLLKLSVLLIAAVAIFLGYRFVLLLIVLYST